MYVYKVYNIDLYSELSTKQTVPSKQLACQQQCPQNYCDYHSKTMLLLW